MLCICVTRHVKTFTAAVGHYRQDKCCGVKRRRGVASSSVVHYHYNYHTTGSMRKHEPDEFRLRYYSRWNNFRICHRHSEVEPLPRAACTNLIIYTIPAHPPKLMLNSDRKKKEKNDRSRRNILTTDIRFQRYIPGTATGNQTPHVQLYNIMIARHTRCLFDSGNKRVRMKNKSTGKFTDETENTIFALF
jgi:hypothetical protein